MRKIPAVLAVLGLTAVGLAGCSLPAGFEDCSRPVSDTAATDLVTQLGGHVHGLAFLIELVALNGRDQLKGQNLHSVLKY